MIVWTTLVTNHHCLPTGPGTGHATTSFISCRIWLFADHRDSTKVKIKGKFRFLNCTERLISSSRCHHTLDMSIINDIHPPVAVTMHVDYMTRLHTFIHQKHTWWFTSFTQISYTSLCKFASHNGGCRQRQTISTQVIVCSAVRLKIWVIVCSAVKPHGGSVFNCKGTTGLQLTRCV